MNALTDRDLRQRDVIPQQRLAECCATVIGVGSIGRQVALQLVAMGMPHLHLTDPDDVDVVNLAPQGYREDDVGRPKVWATAHACHEVNSQVAVTVKRGRFQRHDKIGNVVACCVDSIATRRLIWQAVKHRCESFVDGRMTAESLRVLTACDDASRRHYETTFFPEDRAFAGTCTARSTIYVANIAAGLMVAQLARRLRGMPTDADLTVNLLASELHVDTPGNA